MSKAVKTLIIVGIGAIATAVTGNPAFIKFALGIAASIIVAPELDSLETTQQGLKEEVFSSVASRKIVYGRARVVGDPVYFGTHGTDDVDLTMIYVVAGHEIEEFETVMINNLPVTIVSDLVTGSRWDSKIRIKFHLGTDAQMVDSDLFSDISEWTTDHRLRGLAYYAVTLTYDPQVFINGRPDISVIIKGAKLFDTRDSSTAWSDNWALQLNDYLIRDPLGCRIPQAEINTTAMNAAANSSDENVTLKAGGTQDRYTSGGVVDTSVERRENIRVMLPSGAGHLVDQSGQYYLYAGEAATASVNFTEDDLRGPISVSSRRPYRERVNRVVGTFMDVQNDVYELTNYPAIIDTSAVTEDDGIVYEKVVNLPFTQNGIRAQRIAKIFKEIARLQKTIVMPAKMKGLQVQAMSVCSLTNSLWSFAADEYRVEKWGIAEGGINLELTEYADAIYAWDETTDEGTPQTAAVPTIDDGAAAPAVAGLSVTPTTLEEGGTKIPALVVTWTAPSANLERTEIQFKRNADSDWEPGPLNAKPVNNRAILTGFLPGESIDVRVRHINLFGFFGDWATSSANSIPADSWTAGETVNVDGIPAADVVNPPPNLAPDPTGQQKEFAWRIGGNWEPVVTTDDAAHWNLATWVGANSDVSQLNIEAWIPIEAGEAYFLSAEAEITGYSSGSLIVDILTYSDKTVPTQVNDLSGPLWNADTSGFERKGAAVGTVTGAAVWARIRFFASSLDATTAKVRKIKLEKNDALTPYVDSALGTDVGFIINPSPNLAPDPSGQFREVMWRLGGLWESLNTSEQGWHFNLASWGGANSDVSGLNEEVWITVAAGEIYVLSAEAIITGYSSGSLVVDVNTYADKLGSAVVDDLGGPLWNADTPDTGFERRSALIGTIGATAIWARIRFFAASLDATTAKIKKIKLEKTSRATAFTDDQLGARVGYTNDPPENLLFDPAGHLGQIVWTLGGNWETINTTDDGRIWNLTSWVGANSDVSQMNVDFWIPIVAGEFYTLSAEVEVTGYVSGFVAVDVLTYQSDKATQVDDSDGPSWYGDTEGFKRKGLAIGTVSGGAVFARVRFFASTLDATTAKVRRIKFEKSVISTLYLEKTHGARLGQSILDQIDESISMTNEAMTNRFNANDNMINDANFSDANILSWELGNDWARAAGEHADTFAMVHTMPNPVENSEFMQGSSATQFDSFIPLNPGETVFITLRGWQDDASPSNADILVVFILYEADGTLIGESNRAIANLFGASTWADVYTSMTLGSGGSQAKTQFVRIGVRHTNGAPIGKILKVQWINASKYIGILKHTGGAP